MNLNDFTIQNDPNEGVWVTAMTTDEGEIAFKCKGTRSRAFRSAENRANVALTNRERNLIRQGDLAAMERLEQSRLKMKAELCVLDWRGLPDTEGKPLPFEKATAVKLMTNPKYRPVRDMIDRCIDMVDEGLIETEETASENLSPTSSGNIAPMSSAAFV